ncbi:FCD domain-containing protein [Microbacterium enclense]|uniref:FCD domain-containing protein n=1 Tax=Microbacterium enclense TaxID=993073 RepID=UPI00203C0B62|nr:FCD domain-containing protein [Microbacterium enclense]MCM3615218.1 FCD domain-containing protein [Microbacterium enclense]
MAAVTRNPLLASLNELTVSWTLGARLFSHVAADGRRLSHEGHARILRALKAGNPDAAEAAMRVHLDEITEVSRRLHD